MKVVRGRVVAITGAGSGIGRALSLNLARRGAILELSDIDEEGLAETLRQLDGADVHSCRLDVSDRQAVFDWADDVRQRRGSAHMIINNAGVAHATSLEAVSLEDFEWLMGINFWGVVYGTKAFLPLLQEQDEAHIVNISSVFGIIAAPLNGTYNAAKFAVRGFTEALRIELEMSGSSVGVSCVHPGGIRTNIARSARRQEGLADIADTFDKVARTTPESCADTIVEGVLRKAPRVLVGPDAYLIDAMQRVSPSGYAKLVARLSPRRP